MSRKEMFNTMDQNL